MNDDTGITEETAATVEPDEGDAAPQLSQTGEQADAAPDVAKEDEGFKKAAIAERKKRQAIEQEVVSLKATIREIQESLKKEPGEDDDERYIQVKDLKKELARFEQKSEQESFSTTYQNNIQRVKASHDDYDDVIALAEDLIENDPEYSDMLQVILASKNGAQIAYNLGKQHPNYIKKIVTDAKKKTVDTIQKNSQRAPSLTGVQGVGNQTIDEVKRIKDMSDAEFKTLTDKMMGL